jgi:hypothetical protein
VYKKHVRGNVRPSLACYAALGEIESPKFRYANDWKIAKLQFNKAELERGFVSIVEQEGSHMVCDYSQRNR